MNMRQLFAALIIVSVALMSGCKKDDYQAKVGVCPEVVSTIPADEAVGVPLNQVISATFNEKMDPAMFTQDNVTLSGTTTIAGTKAATTVAGTVVFSGMTVFFTPTSPLAPNTTYTGTIKAGVKDLMGNALQVDHVWSFSTDVAPAVTADPINNAVDVLLDKVIVATFSVPMDTLTLKAPATTASVKQGTTIVPGKYSFTTTTATFTPTVALSPFTVYTLTITTAAKNALGTPLATDYAWSFTTIPQITVSPLPVLGGTVAGGGTFAQGSSVTVTAVPNLGYSFTNWTEGVTVVSTNASYPLNMAGNKTLVANFATGTSTFTLNTTCLNGTVVKLPNTATYNSGATVQLTATPATGFVFTSWSGDASPVTVTMNGNKNITANFTAAVHAGPLNIDLGSAGDFAVLGGSGVSNTGVTTRIIGDVGSFPTATIDGLLAGNVNGILYMTADPIVGQAKIDLTTAYNDGQARSLDAISLAGQLGGLTLVPGLYVNSSTSGISGTGSNAILTLDAGGDANAVWIFKVGSTFVTDAGTSIVLAGGA